MKIILIQDIPKLGYRGDIKDVSPIYARNVLLRNGQASLATPDNLKRLEKQSARLEQEKAQKQVSQDKLAKQISSASLTIKEKSNDQGKLFAGIDSKKIAALLLKEKKINIEAGQIKLKTPIKEIGSYEIGFEIGTGIKGEFKLKVS